MNIRDLKYLTAVAKFKHFGKAAEACFVSQPTLSMQIKKLEDTLGVDVFERSNKQVFITGHGHAIIKQAQIVLNEVENLKEIANLATDPLSGEYKLGIIPTLAPYLLPHVLPQLKKQLPKLKLFIREEKTKEGLKLLNEGELDAVILALPVAMDGLTAVKLFNEPFYVALPKEHKLNQKKQITIADLKNQNLMLLEEGHCLRDQALEVCSFPLENTQEFNATSLETLWQMVATGVGITLVPALSTKSMNISKSLIAIKPFKKNPSRNIGMLWRKGSVKGQIQEIISRMVKEKIGKVLGN